MVGLDEGRGILEQNMLEPIEAGVGGWGVGKERDKKKDLEMLVGKNFGTPMASKMFYMSSHAKHLLSTFYTVSP